LQSRRLFDALLLAGNGIKKFAMQVQMKDFGHGLVTQSSLGSNLQRIGGVKLTEHEKLLYRHGVQDMLRGRAKITLWLMPDCEGHRRDQPVKSEHIFEIDERRNLLV
jgi:hypothetical protein